MTKKLAKSGITFRVDDVDAATTLLYEQDAGSCIENLLSAVDSSPKIKLLSWSQYNSRCVLAHCHPLIAAVHTSFAEHRPLVLSPDVIWIAILQGLAQHVKLKAETLRSTLVDHKGRMTIPMISADLTPLSPEAAWEPVIEGLSATLAEMVGSKYERLVSDFSTTGDIERIVCRIVLMDVFEPYFDFKVWCGCGIPSITLEGETADWQNLMTKVEALNDYELDWWLEHLRPILRQFERASKGHVDLRFWQNIYKRREVYLSDRLNGWIVKLFPYLLGSSGIYDYPNPFLVPHEEPDAQPGVATSMLPFGIAMVPFQLVADGRTKMMQFLGGFVGIEQDRQSLALKPKMGWAVRRAPQCSWLPDDCADSLNVSRPLNIEEFEMLMGEFQQSIEVPRRWMWQNEQFINFYRQCDGITYADKSSGRIAKVRALAEVVAQRRYENVAAPLGDTQPIGLPAYWGTVGDLLDGSTAQLLFGPEKEEGLVYRAAPDGARTILAETFTDFIRDFVASEGLL